MWGQESEWQLSWENWDGELTGKELFGDYRSSCHTATYISKISLNCNVYLRYMYSAPPFVGNPYQRGGCPQAWKMQSSNLLQCLQPHQEVTYLTLMQVTLTKGHKGQVMWHILWTLRSHAWGSKSGCSSKNFQRPSLFRCCVSLARAKCRFSFVSMMTPA